MKKLCATEVERKNMVGMKWNKTFEFECNESIDCKRIKKSAVNWSNTIKVERNNRPARDGNITTKADRNSKNELQRDNTTEVEGNNAT